MCMYNIHLESAFFRLSNNNAQFRGMGSLPYISYQPILEFFLFSSIC